MREYHAEQAYLNLLQRLPREVAERLQQKYEENRQEFVNYVNSLNLPQEPSYWAERSCTKCYGRGIIGELTAPTGEKSTPTCSCTVKSYRKRLKELRSDFNSIKRETGHAE